MFLSVCFFSIIHLFYQMGYFMNLLLVFEMFSLCVFLVCVCLGEMCFSVISVYVCVVLLCLAVSESVMGLSLLANCSRLSGQSQVSSFSLLSV